MEKKTGWEEEPYRKTFGVKLPEDLIDAVKRRANEENLSIRDFMERMLRDYLKEHPSRQGKLF